MKWVSVEPDIKIDKLSFILNVLNLNVGLFFVHNVLLGCRLFAYESCMNFIANHTRSYTKEIGGILVGKVFENDLEKKIQKEPIVLLTEAIPTSDFNNSAISLKMGTEIWNRTNEVINDNDIVVGWYHSHPNLGVFFSQTDRGTQRAFFNNNYSIGIVIDPIRNEQKIFSGKNSDEYLFNINIVPDLTFK